MSTQDLSSNEQAKRQGINPTDAIVDLLEASVGPDLFDMWFNRGCIEVSEEATGCVVRVFAKNEFSARRLQQTFSKEIKNAVERVCGPQTTIRVEVAQADLDSAGQETEALASSSANPVDSSVQQAIPFTPSGVVENGANRSIRRAMPTLEEFSFASDARLLRAGVAQLFESPGQFSPLFIHGPTGCGKTHLLEAITHGFRKKLRLKRCVYVSAEQFTTQFVGSLRQGTGLPMFRRKFRGLDLLAIDDIQFWPARKRLWLSSNRRSTTWCD